MSQPYAKIITEDEVINRIQEAIRFQFEIMQAEIDSLKEEIEVLKNAKE